MACISGRDRNGTLFASLGCGTSFLVLEEAIIMRSRSKVSNSFRALMRGGVLGGAVLAFVVSSTLAQQVEILAPEPLSVSPAVNVQTSDGVTNVQTVGWRNRYYGRPYGGDYYGPPRGRYYSGYRGYYDGPGPYYGSPYGGYGYGYRGGYYGTPRVGYYDGYYGGGAVRVGPLRFGWR